MTMTTTHNNIYVFGNESHWEMENIITKHVSMSFNKIEMKIYKIAKRKMGNISTTESSECWGLINRNAATTR